MASDEPQPLIVKKRKNVQADGHHGGAWKVAYADFVTAMMAFFLLMWLLNATSEEQRKGLADYFDPSLPISRNSAGGAGMLDGETMFSTERAAGSRKEGVRPKPTHKEPGPTLGDRPASPANRAEDGPGEPPAPGAVPNRAEVETPDPALQDAESELRDALETAHDDLPVDQVRVRMTPEGLVIELVEADGQPLFASGSARGNDLLRALLGVVVPVLNQTRNPVSIVGHTDALPYRGADGYGNWELSSDRANTARRLLESLGFDTARIASVVGRAATQPLNDDPAAPQNRRIAITLLRAPPR